MTFFKHLVSLVMVFLSVSTVTFANETTNKKQDGEIIAFVKAVNTEEINLSEIALSKKVNDDVTEFAEMMRKDHSESLKEINELSSSENIPPVETQAIKEMMARAQKKAETLSHLNGQSFSTAYANGMVKGHTEALEKVKQFTKTAHNEKLKDYLENLQEVIETHLEHAKELQADVTK